jgi:hypothetical protein
MSLFEKIVTGQAEQISEFLTKPLEITVAYTDQSVYTYDSIIRLTHTYVNETNKEKTVLYLEDIDGAVHVIGPDRLSMTFKEMATK